MVRFGFVDRLLKEQGWELKSTDNDGERYWYTYEKPGSPEKAEVTWFDSIKYHTGVVEQVSIDYDVFDTWLFVKESEFEMWFKEKEGMSFTDEPLFNIYVTTEDATDGEPREQNFTLDDCEKYCKRKWREFQAGKFNPWGYGTLNPVKDDFTIECYCNNGMTDDWFGLASFGNRAGKFTDCPDKL